MQTNQNKKTVFIVDDHQLIRQGLKQLINHEHDLEVVGEAVDADETLTKLPQSVPDIITIDISLEGMSGIELTKKVKLLYPDLPVLILSMYDELTYARRSLRAGASGYIMKSDPQKQIITGIRTIFGGEIFVSKRITEKILQEYAYANTSGVECLSDRELEVFMLIGQGHSTRQIAERLSLSPRTVETYRNTIKEKVGIATSGELMRFAVQWVIAELVASY